jgi:hypothetical protein
MALPIPVSAPNMRATLLDITLLLLDLPLLRTERYQVTLRRCPCTFLLPEATARFPYGLL